MVADGVAEGSASSGTRIAGAADGPFSAHWLS